MGNSNLYESVDTAKNLIIDNWSLSSQPDITLFGKRKLLVLWTIDVISYY